MQSIFHTVQDEITTQDVVDATDPLLHLCAGGNDGVCQSGEWVEYMDFSNKVEHIVDVPDDLLNDFILSFWILCSFYGLNLLVVLFLFIVLKSFVLL